MKQDEILNSYRVTKSIKRTAIDLGVSHGVVKKVLITAGIYETPLTKRIRELQASGMPQKDIADLLKISESSVNMNSRYCRGTYLDSNKSENAIHIKEWRERKK